MQESAALHGSDREPTPETEGLPVAIQPIAQVGSRRHPPTLADPLISIYPGFPEGPSRWLAPGFSCPLIRRRIWPHRRADALGLVDQRHGSGDRLRRVGFRLPGAFSFLEGLNTEFPAATSKRGKRLEENEAPNEKG
jgi:hypothetical protein